MHKDQECGVCYHRKATVKIVACGKHYACAECFLKFSKKEKWRCPFCRARSLVMLYDVQRESKYTHTVEL